MNKNSSIRWPDRFIPRAIEADPRASRRARLALHASGAVLASQVIGIGYSLSVGLTAAAVVMTLASLVLVALPPLLRRTGSLALHGNLLAGALLTPIVTISALDRGVETPLLFALAAVCLVATFLAGLRSGIAWAVISLLSIASLLAAHLAGVEFPHMLDGPQEVINSAMIASMLLVVVVAVAATYEALERRAEMELARTVDELRAAKIAAEAASESKSLFLATMSHELRTPLNAILGYAELLAEDAAEMPPGAADDLARIQASGRHLLKLVSDVLDLSKIESGRMELVAEPLAPSAILDALASAVHVLAEKRGNSVELAVAELGDSWLLRSDEMRLRQVLMNLLSNACKFTQDGTVRVGFEVEPLASPPVAVFRVSDTGIGMSEDELDRVFLVFEQGDGSATRKFGGTGLGLAISRRLTELLGGELTARSESGEGSEFTLRLPLSPAS